RLDGNDMAQTMNPSQSHDDSLDNDKTEDNINISDQQLDMLVGKFKQWMTNNANVIEDEEQEASADDFSNDSIVDDSDSNVDSSESLDVSDEYDEDPNLQGTIRQVDKAHLVYKRVTDEGFYEELWFYNI